MNRRLEFFPARTAIARLAAAFAALAALTCAGGAQAQSRDSLTWLEWVGRYSELEQLAERQARAERTASRLGPLCVAYARLKRYDKLFACADELQARIAQGDATIRADLTLVPSSDATPLPHTLRAEAWIDLADYPKAVLEARAALEKTGKSSAGFGASELWSPIRYRLINHANLGLAEAFLRHREAALAQVDALKQVSTASFGNYQIWGAMRQYGAGRLYFALGDYERAIEHLNPTDTSSILARFGSSLFGGGDSFVTMVDVPRQLMLAKAYLEKGNVKDGKSWLEKLIANPRLADQGDMHWIALSERGRLAEREGDAQAALALYARAVEIIEQQRSTLSTEATKIGFVGDKQQVYYRLIALLARAGRAAEAFDYVERSKSRALIDMLASKRDFALEGEDRAGVAGILGRIEAAELVSRAYDAAPQGTRSLTVARTELRSAAPELATLVTVTSVPSPELQKLLAPEEVLIEYYYQEQDLYAFVLTGTALRVVKLDAAGLFEEVQALRRGVEDPLSPGWTSASRALFDRLIKPLDGALAAASLVIVPHGVLHYVPFGALQREDGGFLLDRFGLRLLPSASVLKFLKPAVAAKGAPLLAFGNPELGDPRLDLAFAEGEARALAELFPESRVLLRREASESNFKQAGKLFSRIHFATHGKFNAAAPLQSGLYLAKDAANDGVLTVGELYAMRIDADLVTLSACETGLGKLNPGDDVVGLARGFLYAGARSIVASLWSVDDKATAELMKVFYRNLATLPKAQALRQAQIAIRASYPHPFFWAPFQLIGRSDPPAELSK